MAALWLAAFATAGLVVGATGDLARASEPEGPLWPKLAPGEGLKAGVGENDSALVIGVESYADVAPVPGAKAMANAWFDWLRTTRQVPPERLKILLDKRAINTEIEANAEEFARLTPEGGTMWVVFIGHGAPSPDGRDGVLVGWDAQQTANGLQQRSVARGALLERIRKARGGAGGPTVAIIDACFSGRTSTGSLVDGLQPLVVTRGAGLGATETVASAGKSDEFAGPLPGADRPAFSYLVLGALSGWAKADGDRDGAITLGEAVGYARDAMRVLVDGRTQTPEVSGAARDLALARAAGEGPDLAVIQQRLVALDAARQAEETRVAVASGNVGPIDGGAGPVRGMRKAVDVEAAKAREAALDAEERARASLLATKKQALALDRDPSVEPADKVRAWERLAALEPVAPYDYRAEASEHAAAWRQVEGLGAAMDADWQTIATLLPLEVVPAAKKDELVARFLGNYAVLGARPSFRAAQQALQRLRASDPARRREPIPEAAVPKGTGVLEAGPGSIPKPMKVVVDVARLQDEDRLAKAIARARATEARVDLAPDAKATGWDEVASLPVKGGNPQAEAARAAARSWRELAALTGQMRADWDQTVKPALGLKTLGLAEKRVLVEDFLASYGKLTTEPLIAEAHRVKASLDRGQAQLDRELKAAEAERLAVETARRAEAAARAEREDDRRTADRLAVAGWTSLAIGGVALGTAGALGFFGQTAHDDLAAVCRADGLCGASQAATIDRLATMRTGTWVALGATGLASLTGLVLHLASAACAPPEATTRGRVTVGASLGGLTLQGGF